MLLQFTKDTNLLCTNSELKPTQVKIENLKNTVVSIKKAIINENKNDFIFKDDVLKTSNGKDVDPTRHIASVIETDNHKLIFKNAAGTPVHFIAINDEGEFEKVLFDDLEIDETTLVMFDIMGSQTCDYIYEDVKNIWHIDEEDEYLIDNDEVFIELKAEENEAIIVNNFIIL